MAPHESIQMCALSEKISYQVSIRSYIRALCSMVYERATHGHFSKRATFKTTWCLCINVRLMPISMRVMVLELSSHGNKKTQKTNKSKREGKKNHGFNESKQNILENNLYPRGSKNHVPSLWTFYCGDREKYNIHELGN